VVNDATVMADPNNPHHIGSSITGTIAKIFVAEGEKVTKKQSLLIIDAMKMETNVLSPEIGEIDSILILEGQLVKTGQLLMKLKS